MDDRVLAAHRQGDLVDLARLYEIAADRRWAAGDTDAMCFFLTQAWVFALEAGDADLIVRLHNRLVAEGRNDP